MNVVVYFMDNDGVIAPVWVIFCDIYYLLDKVVGREM